MGEETGEMYATYAWETRVEFEEGVGEFDWAFDPFNNSIMGARKGDKLKIYDARYKGIPNHVALPFHYYVLNEQAYQRVFKLRKSAVEQHIKLINV